MRPHLTSLSDPKYRRFKDYVNSFKQTRYYIIDFVSISELRAQGKPTDDIANITSEHFDDHAWPIQKGSTNKAPEHWATVSETWAKEHITEQLCGGPNFGHREYAMSLQQAKSIWTEFINFFDDSRVFYHVSLGDPNYAFQSGILVVDKDKAGVLNVVQDD